MSEGPNPDDALMPWVSTEQPDPKFWMMLLRVMHETQRIEKKSSTDADVPPEVLSVQFLVHNLSKLLLAQPYFAERPELCAPMLRLSMALFDLNHGRSPALFKPIKRKNHAPGQPNTHAIVKGNAARALSELIEAGMPKGEAARKIALALQSANKKLPQNITAKTVEHWRERFEQGEGPGSPEAALVAYRCSPGPPGDTPLARGLFLIDQLKQYAALIL